MDLQLHKAQNYTSTKTNQYDIRESIDFITQQFIAMLSRHFVITLLDTSLTISISKVIVVMIIIMMIYICILKFILINLTYKVCNNTSYYYITCIMITYDDIDYSTYH